MNIEKVAIFDGLTTVIIALIRGWIHENQNLFIICNSKFITLDRIVINRLLLNREHKTKR